METNTIKITCTSAKSSGYDITFYAVSIGYDTTIRLINADPIPLEECQDFLNKINSWDNYDDVSIEICSESMQSDIVTNRYGVKIRAYGENGINTTIFIGKLGAVSIFTDLFKKMWGDRV